MQIFYSFWIDIHLYFVIDMVFSYHVMILHNFMVVFCNPWLSKNIVYWGQYLNFVQYYFVGQLYFDHCTQKFKCVLNILFDKQNNLYQRGFLGRWQTLHIIYGNIPRSVSENVLENKFFFEHVHVPFVQIYYAFLVLFFKFFLGTNDLPTPNMQFYLLPNVVSFSSCRRFIISRGFFFTLCYYQRCKLK